MYYEKLRFFNRNEVFYFKFSDIFSPTPDLITGTAKALLK